MRSPALKAALSLPMWAKATVLNLPGGLARRWSAMELSSISHSSRCEAPRAEFFALPPALNQTGVAEPTPQEHNVSTAFAARSRSIATDHGPPTLEDESASVAPFQTTVLLLRCCFNNQRGRTLPR